MGKRDLVITGTEWPREFGRDNNKSFMGRQPEEAL
jgi:hypothetical protein